MASLGFDLFARDRGASRNIEKLGKSADQSSKKFGMLQARTKHMSAGMKVGFGTVATAMGAIGGIAVFKGFLDEAREAGKVSRITENAIRATGGAAKISADGVGKLAEQLSNKTAIDDEVIQTGANLLLTFKNVRNEAGKGANIFDRATAAAVDLSVQFGSVDSASKMLGKALNDPIKGISALSRAGVTFTEQQKEQIKTLVASGKTLEAQQIILKEVEAQVGGAAAAAADPIQRLTVVWGNLQEKIGTKALPALESVTNWIIGKGIPGVERFGGVVGQMGEDFGKLPEPVKIGTLALTGITVAAPLIAAGYQKIKAAVESVTVAYQTMGRAGKLSLLTLGPIGAVLAAGTVALGVFASKHLEAEQRIESFTEAIKADSGAVGENTREKIQNAIVEQDLASKAQAAGVSIGTVAKAIAGDTEATRALEERSNALGNELFRLQQNSGFLTDAERARAGQLPGMINATELLITGTRGLSGEVAQGRKNWELSTLVGGEVTKALGENTSATNSNAEANKALRTELQGVIDKQLEASGVVLSARDAQRRYEESVDNARQALKDNGKTLDRTTEKGRANESALDAMAKAALDQAAAMHKNGASQTATRQKIEKARAEFIRTARQMGLSKKAAQELANKLGLIPGKYKATIHADTSRATRTLQSFYREWNNKGLDFNVGAMGALSGRVRRAYGGPIFGPGGETEDRIPVMASNNEHMWSAAEVRGAGGHAAVKRMRDMARARKLALAKGGPITLRATADTSDIRSDVRSMWQNLSSSGGGGAGVERWRGTGLQALSMAGSPLSWIGSLLRRMNQESGGNPRAINLWDINAKRGIPSKGLMQVIDPTFNAYAGRLRGLGVWNPLANIFASINYANARYGAAPIGWNRAGGYDNGGWLQPGTTLAHNGTGKPEAVFTQDQLKSMGGGATVININLHGTERQLEDKLMRKLESMRRQGRISFS